MNTYIRIGIGVGLLVRDNPQMKKIIYKKIMKIEKYLKNKLDYENINLLFERYLHYLEYYYWNNPIELDMLNQQKFKNSLSLGSVIAKIELSLLVMKLKGIDNILSFPIIKNSLTDNIIKYIENDFRGEVVIENEEEKSLLIVLYNYLKKKIIFN